MAPVMIGMTAFAVDYGRVVSKEAQIQNALDSATLAATQALSYDAKIAASEMDKIAKSFFEAEGQRWFDQLSEGGRAVMPFGETFWSPGFGSLVDRFGVPWMINVVPSADWKPAQG